MKCQNCKKNRTCAPRDTTPVVKRDKLKERTGRLQPTPEVNLPFALCGLDRSLKASPKIQLIDYMTFGYSQICIGWLCRLHRKPPPRFCCIAHNMIMLVICKHRTPKCTSHELRCCKLQYLVNILPHWLNSSPDQCNLHRNSGDNGKALDSGKAMFKQEKAPALQRQDLRAQPW